MGLARNTLQEIERRLRVRAGLELPAWVVEARVTQRMSALDVGERAYVELVASTQGDAEIDALVQLVRVGETRFFRHRRQVDALVEVVVPTWRARGERSPRIWSVGCASGEEAYTLALVMAHELPRPDFFPSIFATDVSAEAIAFARRGVYPGAVAEHVPEPWRDGLRVDEDRVQVRPEVGSLVKFAQKNLAEPDQPRGFDLIWCRNVLIYFGAEERRLALERLVAALEPGGFLFVGHSESLRDVVGLRDLQAGYHVVWEKPERASTIPLTPRLQTTPLPPTTRRGTQRDSAPVISIRSPDRELGGGAPSVTTPSAPSSSQTAVTVRVTDLGRDVLAAQIAGALRGPGLKKLTIDLDEVEFLADEVAAVLRRARAAAAAIDIEVTLRASKSGTQRWLRRNGLAGGEA